MPLPVIPSTTPWVTRWCAGDVLGRTYAAVVGNPPYITVKDATLRDRYRKLYPESAAGKYSLAAPFVERFLQLASPRGFVGTITANSFMKREFGKKVIESVLPRVSLDGIVNTSGAYIPGHGTPTVILFGTNERPVGTSVLAVQRARPCGGTSPAAQPTCCSPACSSTSWERGSSHATCV